MTGKNGGVRPGAGRPKGAKNKLTQEAIDFALQQKVKPMEFWFKVINSDDWPQNLQLKASENIAKYIYRTEDEDLIQEAIKSNDYIREQIKQLRGSHENTNS